MHLCVLRAKHLGMVPGDFAAFSFTPRPCRLCTSQVSPKELAEIMRGLGDKLSDEEISLLVKVADKDGDGTISIEE